MNKKLLSDSISVFETAPLASLAKDIKEVKAQYEIRERILEILKERDKINITDFHNLIPESKGEYAMYMPVKGDANPNIILMSGVSMRFINAFNELIMNQITFEVGDIYCFMFDGSPLYGGYPLCKKRNLKGKKECWLPIVIKLKK